MKRLSIKVDKKYFTTEDENTYVGCISGEGASCYRCAFRPSQVACSSRHPCVLEERDPSDNFIAIHWVRVK